MSKQNSVVLDVKLLETIEDYYCTNMMGLKTIFKGLEPFASIRKRNQKNTGFLVRVKLLHDFYEPGNNSHS